VASPAPALPSVTSSSAPLVSSVHAHANATLPRPHAITARGLGNVAFACACTDESSGALLEVTLGNAGAGEATIIPIDAGLEGAAARASGDPGLAFDLLEALGATRLERRGDRARF